MSNKQLAADVVIVGGGIVGAASAFFLRKRGLSVREGSAESPLLFSPTHDSTVVESGRSKAGSDRWSQKPRFRARSTTPKIEDVTRPPDSNMLLTGDQRLPYQFLTPVGESYTHARVTLT